MKSDGIHQVCSAYHFKGSSPGSAPVQAIGEQGRYFGSYF